MTRRQKSTRIKHICRDHGLTDVSVKLGQGTAYHWVYINTEEEVPGDIRVSIEAVINSEGLCGTYYSDCGPGSDIPGLCLSWR